MVLETWCSMSKVRIIHPGNFQCFLDIYRTELEKAVKSNPEQYAWNIQELEVVFKRMSAAIEHGSFNKDSEAIKRTCKALNIKHTYRAIDEFILTGEF